jgi:4-amino-4-deoxy-L-arabinose transferase-like glycosyltransferase
MDGWRRIERWALVCLFLLAFLPRALYPVSRPLQWYFRSAEFFQATLRGDWAGTLFSEHPGVTVMWLSGAALWGWYTFQSFLGLSPPTPLETEGYAFADRVAVGVLPLALLVALGIVWGWHLLRRLFGRRVAWLGALLWALDPFYLANSKVLHLDATLSTLMLLSALWMLIYLREGRRKALIISAVLGGLAVLTKVTALFLIPFLGLCFLVPGLLVPRGSDRPVRPLSSLVCPFFLWVLIAVAICFVLWPSLWVHPIASLDLVVRQGILLHTGGPRDQPLFYRGELGVHDPGPGFYLDVLLYRSTFLTLPLAGVGLLAPWVRARDADHRDKRLNVVLLTSFAAFYIVQMSLGGWKDGRYMLPVLLVVDVLAACGLDWVVEQAPLALRGRHAVVAGLVLVQAAIVLFRHPYYGTHYNELLGGAARASRIFPLAEFGEGLDLAGQYVDRQPDADDAVIGTQFLANEMVAQHVRAPVRDIAQTGDDADYLVFGVQYTMRGSGYPRWGELWEETYKFREPLLVARFDGLPYAWVHSPDARPPAPQPVNVRLGRAIELVGYRLAQSEVSPGDTLLLTLYWRAETPVEGAYAVFTHLQRPDGELVAQQDNPPRRGAYPTDIWSPGTLVEDPYEIQVPLEAKPGEYTLSTGMYDPATMERLPVETADGERLPNDRLELTTVHVRPSVPPWRWVLSAGWLALVAAGVVLPQVVAGTRQMSEHDESVPSS